MQNSWNDWILQRKKNRSKAGLSAPQALSGFLSWQSLPCQESHQQDLPTLLFCHQIHLVLIFKAVSGRTRCASTKHTYLVFPEWTTVGQRPLMPQTWGRPQVVHKAQIAFISLSLWFLKSQANVLLHAEMGEGEGKETGEQRQEKRQDGGGRRERSKWQSTIKSK